MQKRINISLPEKTLRLLDRVTTRGKRSRFIDAAVRDYVKRKSRARIREELAEGYRQSAEEDLSLAAEWFPVEEEAWEKSGS